MDGKVQQFVAITGSTVEAARGMIEACGGNLDLAVNMFLESGSGGAGPSSSSSGDVTSKSLSYEEV